MAAPGDGGPRVQVPASLRPGRKPASAPPSDSTLRTEMLLSTPPQRSPAPLREFSGAYESAGHVSNDWTTFASSCPGSVAIGHGRRS